jgi:hypothetical protein
MYVKACLCCLKFYYFAIKDFNIVFYIPIVNILSLHLIRIGLTVLVIILKNAAEYSTLISITNL